MLIDQLDKGHMDSHTFIVEDRLEPTTDQHTGAQPVIMVGTVVSAVMVMAVAMVELEDMAMEIVGMLLVEMVMAMLIVGMPHLLSMAMTMVMVMVMVIMVQLKATNQHEVVAGVVPIINVITKLLPIILL